MMHFGSQIPLNDLGNSQCRLDAIMSRRRLSFNPYTVDDERLLEIANTTGWGGTFDLVQIVVLRFTQLLIADNTRGFDGIFMQVGNSKDAIFLPAWRLKLGVTAFDTLRHESTQLNHRSILHDEQIEKLVGKSVFVSHTIPGRTIRGIPNVAYKMHRLKGAVEEDAATIRKSMCDAKIEMLTRLRDNPGCRHYLDCSPDLFDFQTRINQAIHLISHFSEATP